MSMLYIVYISSLYTSILCLSILSTSFVLTLAHVYFARRLRHCFILLLAFLFSFVTSCCHFTSLLHVLTSVCYLTSLLHVVTSLSYLAWVVLPCSASHCGAGLSASHCVAMRAVAIRSSTVRKSLSRHRYFCRVIGWGYRYH